MRKFAHPASVALVLLLFTCGAGAQTTINVGTTGSATANYTGFSANAGPYPFTNFGIQAGANLTPGPLDVSVGGATPFSFPLISPGQQFTPGSSTLAVGYTPGWTGSVSDSASFGVNTKFVYGLGPFSGSANIFNLNLGAGTTGNLGLGGQLPPGVSANTANASLWNFGLSLNALFASASAGFNIGASLTQQLNWNPTVNYGYDVWTNTTGTLSPSDVLTFNSVNSGPLSFQFPPSPYPSGTNFYVNLLPAIQLDMPIIPTSILGVPVNGYLNASAFGSTIVDYHFPLGDLFQLPVTYDPWDVTGTWYGGNYLSVPLEFTSICPPNGIACFGEYTVGGGGVQLDPNLFLPDFPPMNPPNGSAGGGFTLGNGGGSTVGSLIPPVCVHPAGPCYPSNDPNLPIGQGTVVTSSAPVPEPATLALLGIGLVGLAATRRRRLSQRTTLRTAASLSACSP